MGSNQELDPAQIEILEGLQAVRVRPTLYVGSLDAADLPVRLLRQSLCHAVDCALSGTCSRVRIRVEGEAAAVSYDAGLPLEYDPRLDDVVARAFFTLLRACHNQKKHLSVGDELCDLGLAVSSALSDEMDVETRWRGRAALYRFRRGAAIDTPEPRLDPGRDATTMRFRLDRELLGTNVVFDPGRVRAAADHLLTLLPGLTVEVDASGA